MKLIMENFKKFLAEQVDFDKAQDLINSNAFLRDVVKLQATADNMIQGSPEHGNYVLFYSPASLKHIVERHKDPNAPGSLFYGDIKKSIESTLDNNDPNEFRDKENKRVEKPVVGGRVKWINVDAGTDVGEEGIAEASPEKVAGMKDYRMPDPEERFKDEDWTPEMVKIAAGERKPTQKINLITGYVGDLEDGKKLITLVTAFPGRGDVPLDRRDFAKEGLYFVLPEDSPLLAGEEPADTEKEV